MIKQKLSAITLLLALAPITFASEAGERKSASQPFTFRRGQAVYIAAFHPIHNIAHYPASSVAASPFIDDLDFEARLKKEFEKKLVFKVASKLSEADFVFLAYIDESAAEGFTLAPQKYSEFKNKLDLDAIREAAYGSYVVGPFRIPTLGKISNRLVEKFQKTAITNGKP